MFFWKINYYEGENTIKYQKRTPNLIGAKLVCIDDRFTLPYIIYKGDDCINKFIKWIFEQKEWIRQIIYQYFNKDLIMTNKDEGIYNNSKLCWVCKEELDTDKVRDYSTVKGKFRGASHSRCNKILEIPKKLPIIFHNLDRYDGHLIFKETNNFNVDLEVIPQTIDKCMSVIVNRNITFMDLLQFIKASLDTLASNLYNKDFKHLVSEFGVDKLEILKGKDAYRYKWVDSYEKFKYPSLPEKKIFVFIIKRW